MVWFAPETTAMRSADGSTAIAVKVAQRPGGRVGVMLFHAQAWAVACAPEARGPRVAVVEAMPFEDVVEVVLEMKKPGALVSAVESDQSTVTLEAEAEFWMAASCGVHEVMALAAI